MICSDGLWESCWLRASACTDDEGQDTHTLALQFIYILLALSLQRKASHQINRSQMQWGLAFQSWFEWDTSLRLPAWWQLLHTALLPSPVSSVLSGHRRKQRTGWTLGGCPVALVLCEGFLG